MAQLLLSHGRGNPLVFASAVFIEHWCYIKDCKQDEGEKAKKLQNGPTAVLCCPIVAFI